MTTHLDPLRRDLLSAPLQTLLIALDKEHSIEKLVSLFALLNELQEIDPEDIFRLLTTLIEKKQIDLFKEIVENGDIILKDLDMTITQESYYSRYNDAIIINLYEWPDETITDDDTPPPPREAPNCTFSLNLLDLALYQHCDIEFIQFLLLEGLRPTQQDNLQLQFHNNRVLQKAYDAQFNIQRPYQEKYQHIVDMYAAIQQAEAAFEKQQSYAACGTIHEVLARYQQQNESPDSLIAESVLYQYVANLIKDLLDSRLSNEAQFNENDNDKIAAQRRILQFVQFIEWTITQTTEAEHRQCLTNQWHTTLRDFAPPLIAADTSQLKDQQFAEWVKTKKTILQQQFLSKGWQDDIANRNKSTPSSNLGFFERTPDKNAPDTSRSPSPS